MFQDKNEEVRAISLIKPNSQEEKLHTWGLGLHVSFETFGEEGRSRPLITGSE